MAQSEADLDAMVQQRRAAYTPPLPEQRRYWGLALSGGGIRSATFCLGLIKALAQKQLFRQFDLMSTVSGGGYAGSSLGKLLHEAGSAQTLEPELARMEASWWLNWLRANGRYLTPNGAKDTLFAFANFGRNLLGVHLELGLMGLLLGCALAAIDLSVWAWASEQAGSAPSTIGTSILWFILPVAATLPTLFVMLPLLAMVAGILSCAYWLLPSRAKAPSITRVSCIALTALGGLSFVSWATWRQFSAVGQTTGRWVQIPHGWLILGVLFMIAWFGGACLSVMMRRRRDYQADIARNQLTRWLGCILILSLAIVLLGWMDQLAWSLARNRETDSLGPALVILGVALRVALPMIANVPKNLAPVARSTLLGLFTIAGIGLLAALLVFWISVVQGLVTAALFRDGAQVAFYRSGGIALMSLALPVLLLMLTSLGNLDFLNRSSLQPFYRARLVRAYLGASTRERMTTGNPGPMQRRVPNPDDLAVAVPVVQDDIAMTDYAPYLSGGPVQLLNVCINQTQDPRGGIFNSDRKGEPMTVTRRVTARCSLRLGANDNRTGDELGRLDGNFRSRFRARPRRQYAFGPSGAFDHGWNPSRVLVG
ncbi:patatin-like phospholipase family protein [Pseudomonas kilonensis]